MEKLKKKSEANACGPARVAAGHVQAQLQPLARGGPGRRAARAHGASSGSRLRGAPRPSPASQAPRGVEGWPGGTRARLLPWLSGRRAGRAGGSGGARAGRASVGTASLRRAPRALGTPPPPPPPLLALVLPPVLPSPLPERPPRPGSNILRRWEHARLENNTTFQKPLFKSGPVPEGKEPGLLLLF